jgi:hypothetical protein
MTSYGPVQRAVRAQLRRLGLSLASSGEAAACVVLAARLDSTEGAAAAALCARELRAALGALSAAAEASRAARNARTVAAVGWDPGEDPELAALAEQLADVLRVP